MRIKDLNIVHVVINEHAPIFYELIELMIDHLQSNGVRVSRTVNIIYPDRLNVIVGHTIVLSPQLFAKIRIQTRNHYILFQMEALDSVKGVFPNRPAYFEFLRGAKQVWEYSPANTRYLAQLGLTNVRYIPIGYSSCLERIPSSGEQDIDILFYGGPSARRLQIMEELRDCRFKAEMISGVYGPVRDTYVAVQRFS
jgi:hypothetical protein